MKGQRSAWNKPTIFDHFEAQNTQYWELSYYYTCTTGVELDNYLMIGGGRPMTIVSRAPFFLKKMLL